MKRKRIILAVTGASGVELGHHVLKALQNQGIELHLILSEGAKETIRAETTLTEDDFTALADHTYSNSDLAAAVSSGSYWTDGMIIAPCSMKTLSGIVNAYDDILTSGTLAAGANFRHFKEETGLLADGRIVESVSPSPFDYKANCLLYLPLHPPELTSSGYFDELAAEIAALLDACWGHALVLFTSYAAMSAIKERLAEMSLPWDIFTLGRNAVHTTQQFKASSGSVLLATGAAWEGFDFPGDCVSLLVIPRLPFSHPDALKEKKRAEYSNLRSFIHAVVVPEMQIKLKQGFGRAIRTETDSCVVAILDERAVPGQRHYEAMRAALPEMQMTDSLEDVVEFIYHAKGPDYFKEGSDEPEGATQ